MDEAASWEEPPAVQWCVARLPGAALRAHPTGWGWAVCSDFAVCPGQGPPTAWLTICPAQPLPPTPETAGLCRAEQRLLGGPVCPGSLEGGDLAHPGPHPL